MTRIRLFILCLIVPCLSGCQSDADRMAEFCLGFVKAAEDARGDCAQMAQSIQNLIGENNATIRQTDVCQTTTACLPCRKAVRLMLSQCGTDKDFRPVLDNFHFSDTLRKSADAAEQHFE